MRKTFVAFISICLVGFSAIIPAAAEEIRETYSEDLSLREIEILKELDEIDPTHDLVEGEVVSVSQIRVSQEEIEGVNDTDLPPSTRGAIKANYMTMTVKVTRLSDPGYDKFLLYSNFKWDKAPFWSKTDGIALAWDKGFTLLNSNITLNYSNKGNDNSKAYLSGTAPGAGVGYVFPMGYEERPMGPSYDLQYGTIRATVRKHDSTGTANVVAKYVHSTLSLSGPSFSFSSSGPSIGVSVTGGYDHREVYTNWNY